MAKEIQYEVTEYMHNGNIVIVSEPIRTPEEAAIHQKDLERAASRFMRHVLETKARLAKEREAEAQADAGDVTAVS